MHWRYRNTVLALCTVAFFATMAARLAISPVVELIATDLAVSNTLIGAALSGMWLTYALVQFPSGVLADRFGERRIILLSIAGTGVATAVIALGPAFAVFFLGAVLLGGLTGLHYSVATTLVTRTFDDIGTAIGVHNAGGPAAGLITPIAVSWVGIRYGWRPAVAVAIVVTVPVFVAFARGIRPTEPRRPDLPMRERFRLEPLRELLFRPQVAFTVVLATVAEFVWQGLLSFLPTFLTQYRGFSPTNAGALFAAYFVALGTLQVGVGLLSDRYGRDAATALCMCAGIVGLAALVAVPGVTAVVAGVVFLGLGMGWGAAVFSRFMDHLSAAERGIGFGLVRTVFMVVAAGGSVTVGFLADRFGWAVSFGTLAALLGAVLCLLAANATLRVRR